jgi:RNA polymerase sigma-70 factor (ECF subfamily)
VQSIPDETGDQNTQEYIKRVEKGLMRLPVDLREMIIMKYHSALTFEEIAGITELSVSAVKMRVYRGLEKLKSSIANEK